MYHSPRRRSPKLKLRPLEPPPWTGSSSDEHSSVTLAKVKPGRNADREPDTAIFSAYPTMMKRPFDDPHEALCRAFNVSKTVDVPKVMTDALPPTLSMRVLPHHTHPHPHALLPTHILLVLDSHYASLPSTHATLHPPLPPPLALPINADLFAQRFASDLRPPGALSAPESSWGDTVHSQEVTLPTIALCVPHPPSVPLLLLYGLGLFASTEPHPPSDGTHKVRATASMGTLAAYLLPTHTIEEFPSAAAMADVLAMGCSDAELRAHALFNGGMWGNVLALAPRDGRIVEMVRTAWNVTAEARKMRERWRRGGGGVVR